MEWITQFFGRFHPVLVHFPIGILILAFLFECLSLLKAYRKIRSAIPLSLLLGALFAVASSFSGYFLSQEGGYDDNLLERHKTLGIATAIFSFIAYFLYVRAGNFFEDKARRKKFYLVLLIPLIILVSITGHFGGSITHGEDYLFDIVNSADEAVDPSIKLGAITDVDKAVLYSDVIQPILESRCYSCHSSRRQKGDLRLDGVAFIQRGGEDGPIIEAGRADSSELFSRLMLSLEDEDHMPPNEKPQPSSSEIALIQSWINEGADFEMKVSESNNVEKIKGYLISVVEQSHKEKLIPDEDVEPGDEMVIANLSKNGIIVLPVSGESNYLSVSFVNKRSVSAEDIQSLLPLKRQIVWLDLSRTTVSDSEIAGITQLASLRRLNLEFTSLSDNGLQSVSSLSNLRYLNLVGTKITDEGLMQTAGLKNLKDLFIYQTAVTGTGIKNYSMKAPHVSIDSGGYQLPKMLTDSVVTKFVP
jgi:uncharacterized membrane protein